MFLEDLPEIFEQGGPLLQLGRIVRPPLPLEAQHPPILEPQECKAFSLFQIHHPTLVFIDRNAELGELLA